MTRKLDLLLCFLVAAPILAQSNPMQPPIAHGIAAGGGGGGVSGLTTCDGGTALADNYVMRADGTTGCQGTGVQINDSNQIVPIAGSSGTPAILSPADVVGQVTGIYFISNEIILSSNEAPTLKVAGLSVTLDTSVSLLLGTGGQIQGGLRKVEANTGGSGSPTTVNNSTDIGSFQTNEGTTVLSYVNLPSAAAGMSVPFFVQDADGMRLVAAAGDTIRVLDKVTAAGGYIESTTQGSVVRLSTINTTEWFAESIHGTWTDGTFTYDDTGNTTP